MFGEPLINLGEGCELDVQFENLIKDGLPIALSPIEFRILYLLSINLGTIVSHQQIKKKVWNSTDEFNPDTLYMAIKRLRDKLEDIPSNPQCILTIRGKGYVLYERKKRRSHC